MLGGSGAEERELGDGRQMAHGTVTVRNSVQVLGWNSRQRAAQEGGGGSGAMAAATAAAEEGDEWWHLGVTYAGS